MGVLEPEVWQKKIGERLVRRAESLDEVLLFLLKASKTDPEAKKMHGRLQQVQAFMKLDAIQIQTGQYFVIAAWE